jgi:hypothetical protein
VVADYVIDADTTSSAIIGGPGDAHEEPDSSAQGHALADEGGSEDSDEHWVLIRPGEAPLA